MVSRNFTLHSCLFLSITLSQGLLSEVNLPYSSDFEANQGYLIGPLNGQDGWVELSGSSIISDEVAYSGTNILALKSGQTVASAKQTFAELIGESIIFADFFIRPATDVGTAGSSVVSSGFSELRFVKSLGEGQIQFRNGDGFGGGQWETLDQQFSLDSEDRSIEWIRITLRMNFLTEKWDLYVDGLLATHGVGAVDNTTSHLSEIVFKGHSNFDTYIDFAYAGHENPLFADIDEDGMEDAWELANGLNAQGNDRNDDIDQDGLKNIHEYQLGSSPNQSDTDGDLLSDGDELLYGRDPLVLEEDSFLLGLGGLRLFLKADEGVVMDSQSKVAAWNDQSGKSNNGIQNYGDFKPQYVPNVFGVSPAVRFDGGDVLDFPDILSNAGAGEIFVIAKSNIDSGTSRGLWRLSSSSASYSGNQLYPYYNGNVYESFGRGNAINIGNLEDPLDQINLYNVFSVSGEWGVRQNGRLEYVTFSNTPVFRTNPSIGKGASNASGFSGEIAEVIIYDRKLSDIERDIVEGYLATKYELPSMAVPVEKPAVNAIGVSPTRVQVWWEGMGSGVDYLLERSANGLTWSEIILIRNGVSTFLDENLAPGTAYAYRVQPMTARGSGQYSDTIYANTLDSSFSDFPSSGMRFWLNPENVLSSSSSYVQRVSDKSGYSIGAWQDDVNGRPRVLPDLMGGLPAFRLDGDFFHLPDILSSAPAGEIFAVLRSDFDSGSIRGLWRFAATGVSYAGGQYYPIFSSVYESFGRGNSINIGDMADPLNTRHLYNVVSTIGEWTVRQNGRIEYTTTSNTPGFRSNPDIGRGASNSSVFSGEIGEIIVYDHRLDEDERAAVNRYLGLKYALPGYSGPKVVVNQAFQLMEDEPGESKTISIYDISTIEDRDGDVITFALADGESSSRQYGELIITEVGGLTFNLIGNYNEIAEQTTVSYNYNLVAQDPTEDPVAFTIVVEITGVNTLPVLIGDLVSIPDATEGVSGYTYTIPQDHFSEVDLGDTLSYELFGLPDGMSFDQVSGVIAGIPTMGSAQASPFDLQLKVIDQSGAESQVDEFELAVLGNNSGFVDSDGDGLDDNWEMSYFGSLNADADDDSDSDGLPHLIEMKLGTDPTSETTRDDESAAIGLEIHFVR